METHAAQPDSQPLTSPRFGVRYVADPDSWAQVLDFLEEGKGPIALDVERASGFRYSQRAYLVQLYRRGGENFLVDPISLPDLSALTERFGHVEWILHAARQDLSSLRELGIHPRTLFDTELGARIAGLERVGLQGTVEDLLGISLAKEHSAADWSTRPLPESWLHYAALDVEVLPDLREQIYQKLVDNNAWDYALEEFSALLREPASAPRSVPWRRLSGLHQVRGARAMAIARELWLAREELAIASDVAPGRLIPDRAIVHAAQLNPGSLGELQGSKQFHGRASRSEIERWWRAIERGRTTDDLPALRVPSDALPPPRAWAEKSPEAHRRLSIARDLVAREATRRAIPAENLLTPEYLRRVCWLPDTPMNYENLDQQLAQLGARGWQRQILVPLLVEAFEAARSLNPET